MKKYLFLLFPLAVGMFALLSANTANASTEFDNVIRTTQTLRVGYTNNLCNSTLDNFDYKYRWPEFLDDNVFNNGFQIDNNNFDVVFNENLGNQTKAQMLSSWNLKQNWAVSQYTDGPNRFFQITFTEVDDTNLVFHKYQDYDDSSLRTNTTSTQVTVNVEPTSNSCRLTVGASKNLNNDIAYLRNYDDSNTNISRVLFIFWGITYPSNYEGIVPPDTGPSPTIDIKYWLDFSYINTPQSITAKYLNKKTDPVSNLEDPDIVWWRIRVDGSTTDTGTIVCDVDLPKNIPFNTLEHCKDLQISTQKEYYLSAQVNPSFNPNIDVPSGYTMQWPITLYKIDFNKSSSGSTDSCEGGALGPNQQIICLTPREINFTECFQIEFPFVDPVRCSDNFGMIFELLFFGTIKVPQFTFEPQCHSLNLMDDWLGLPNGYTVCPQIPLTVRNVVTPFVAFMLGLVTLKFIQRRSGDYNG